MIKAYNCNTCKITENCKGRIKPKEYITIPAVHMYNEWIDLIRQGCNNYPCYMDYYEFRTGENLRHY